MKERKSPNTGVANLDWTEELAALVTRGEWVSVDFWNTLVIETSSREFVRKLVCSILVNEFELKLNSEDIYEDFRKVSNGLISLSKDFGLDNEYKLASAWFFSGVNFFSDEVTAQTFANRAIEIEIEISFMNSFVHEETRDTFNSLLDHERLLIVSDFEGDSKFLRQVARLHDLVLPEIVLVSSEHLLNKRSSRLFKVHPNLGKNSFHFGDSHSADIIGAEMAEITAIQVKHLSPLILKKTKRSTFPLPIPSFRNDKKACAKMAYYFKSELQSFINPGDHVIFLGSEGAFLSHSITECQENVTYSCFNGGRRIVMLACLETQTAWVTTRCLQENVNLQVLLEIFGVDMDDYEAKKRAFFIISSAERNLNELLSADQISRSRAAKSQIARDFAITSNNQRNVLVDIGYRGTFAQSVARLFDCQVSVIQVFGNESQLNQADIVSRTLFSESDGFDFRGSISMIELLFGAGPRATISDGALLSFQKDLWKPVRNSRRGNLRKEMERVLHWPSRRLIKLIAKSIRSDDLSQEYIPFFAKNVNLRDRITNNQLAHYYAGNLWVLALFLIRLSKNQFLEKIAKHVSSLR